MTLDFIIADMSEYTDDKISVPNFDVVSTFSSKKQAQDTLDQINQNERIVNDIREITTRDPATDEGKAIIKVLKKIMEKSK